LKNIIKKNAYKIQLYLCGHEHNLQYLEKDNDYNYTKMGFVISGREGAKLDKEIHYSDQNQQMTQFIHNDHGYVSIEMKNEILKINFIMKTEKIFMFEKLIKNKKWL